MRSRVKRGLRALRDRWRAEREPDQSERAGAWLLFGWLIPRPLRAHAQIAAALATTCILAVCLLPTNDESGEPLAQARRGEVPRSARELVFSTRASDGPLRADSMDVANETLTRPQATGFRFDPVDRDAFAVPAAVRLRSQFFDDRLGANTSNEVWVAERNREADGSFCLQIEARGFVSQRLAVVGRRGERTDLGQITLERGADLSGRLWATQAVSFEGAYIFACDATRLPDPEVARYGLPNASVDLPNTTYFDLLG